MHATEDAIYVGNYGGVGNHGQIQVAGVGERAEADTDVAAEEAAEEGNGVQDARPKHVERDGGARNVCGDQIHETLALHERGGDFRG